MEEDVELLERLVKQDESEYLDFKQELPKLDASLLHDILCFANVRSSNARYLVYGITDNKKRCGVHEYLKDHDFRDWLRHQAIKLNKELSNHIKIRNIQSRKKKFVVIEIQDSHDKPFFLLQDYEKNAKIIRAGVTYSRHGSMNTAINSTVPDDELAEMWKERFHMNRQPLERFEYYLETEKWQKIKDHSTEYFCTQYENFRIKEVKHLEKRKVNNVPISDRWFPNSWAAGGNDIFPIQYSLYCDSSVIKDNITLWWGDGMREVLPIPQSKNSLGDPSSDADYQDIENYTWNIDINSIEYKVCKVISDCHKIDLNDALKRSKIN